MEKQKTLVIDASVMVKWFLNEENSDKARIIRSELENGDISIIVPELLFLEIPNSLRYNKVKEKNILTANKILFGTGLEVAGLNEEIMLKAIENSIKYNITIYDSLYVTIAQLHGIALITADKKLYKIPNVIALEKT